jgi:hypothetical protein
MKRLRHACLLAIALVGAAAPAMAHDTWMSVTLDGRKIGQLHTLEERLPERVSTTQAFSIDLTRSGQVVHVSNTTRNIETRGGQPIAFSLNTRLSGDTASVAGRRLPDGGFQLVSTVGGERKQRVFDWPGDAVMAYGQRLQMQRHGLKPGTDYTMITFDPSTQQGVILETRVKGIERVELPGGPEHLHHLQQTLFLTHTKRHIDLWVDDDYRVRKGRSHMLGFVLEMNACSRACATAPNQPIDLLSRTMVSSPIPLTKLRRSRPMRYLIRFPAGSGYKMIDTDEQAARQVRPGLWQVDVGVTRTRHLPPPTPADSAPNAWLQSDAKPIIELARKAVGDARSPRQRIQRMSDFVHDYLKNQTLNVGYASALEAARTRTGDCSEHAVLLAAMARSQGIPARIVSGLAFAPRFGGQDNVFITHLWVVAWVDHRWRSYDPTLQEFDSGHIALSVGDGDPWRSYSNLDVLGHMHVEQAANSDEESRLSPPPPPTPPGNDHGQPI